MKTVSAVFLQIIVVLTGIAVLAFLLWAPLTEGRATNLDLFSIYADPFILYGYVASIAFFVGLYKVFRLLGYIGHDKIYTSSAVKTLKSIKYCAIALCVFIVGAGLYIMLFHHKDDDPAGFFAMCIILIFASVVVAIAAAKFEKLVQNAVDMKSGNDLTV